MTGKASNPIEQSRPTGRQELEQTLEGDLVLRNPLTPFTAKEMAKGERNLQILNNILKRRQAAQVSFDAGDTLRVDMLTANMLVAMHKALSMDNQKKFVGMLGRSGSTFGRMIDFGWKNVGIKVTATTKNPSEVRGMSKKNPDTLIPPQGQSTILEEGGRFGEKVRHGATTDQKLEVVDGDVVLRNPRKQYVVRDAEGRNFPFADGLSGLSTKKAALELKSSLTKKARLKTLRVTRITLPLRIVEVNPTAAGFSDGASGTIPPEQRSAGFSPDNNATALQAGRQGRREAVLENPHKLQEEADHVDTETRRFRGLGWTRPTDFLVVNAVLPRRNGVLFQIAGSSTVHPKGHLRTVSGGGPKYKTMKDATKVARGTARRLGIGLRTIRGKVLVKATTKNPPTSAGFSDGAANTIFPSGRPSNFSPDGDAAALRAGRQGRKEATLENPRIVGRVLRRLKTRFKSARSAWVDVDRATGISPSVYKLKRQDTGRYYQWKVTGTKNPTAAGFSDGATNTREIHKTTASQAARQSNPYHNRKKNPHTAELDRAPCPSCGATVLIPRDMVSGYCTCGQSLSVGMKV